MAIKVKNALKIRQEFGAVLDELEDGGNPVVIERRSKPIAVLVPYDVFKERFLEHQSSEDRAATLSRFRAALKKAKVRSIDEIRDLRYDK